MNYQIINHGIENSDYFQGCGTYGTEYNQAYTGIGDSPREALADAIEQAACDGVEITPEIEKEAAEYPETPDIGQNDESVAEMYCYVSIRINTEE